MPAPPAQASTPASPRPPAPGRVDRVAVAKAGTGAGAVTSVPAGIDCGATCSEDFETRKTVTLNAEPAPGSTFTGWTGACTGTGACQVRLTAATSAAATFESDPGGPSTVTVIKPASEEPNPPGATPKPTSCRKGFKLKKVGKVERCVKTPKHRHPHRHKHRRHHP